MITYILAGIPVAAVLYVSGVFIYLCFEEWLRSPYWQRDLKELAQKIFWLAVLIWVVWGFATIGKAIVLWLR
jgi:hypothetical protein